MQKDYSVPLSVRNRLVQIGVSLLCLGGVSFWIVDRVHRASLSRPLIQAVQQEDLNAVRTLLKRGADPNARLADTPASGSLLSILRELFSPSRQSSIANAPTALLIAAQHHQNTAILKLLIAQGADIEKPGEFGYSWADRTSIGPPLIAAACNRHPEMVDILLEHGANPNAVSRTRQTALMFAAVKGEAGMVKSLLARGANPNARDIYGNFPLGDTADWNLRYEKGWIQYRIDGKWRADAEAEHLHVLELLVGAGADPRALHPDGSNALREAAAGKHVSIVRFLLAQGADPRIADKKGGTPLHYAVTAHADIGDGIPVEHTIESLRLLLKAGADINARTVNGKTSLMLAVEDQSPPVVRFLLSQRADIASADLKDRIAEWKASDDPSEQKMYLLFKQAHAEK